MWGKDYAAQADIPARAATRFSARVVFPVILAVVGIAGTLTLGIYWSGRSSDAVPLERQVRMVRHALDASVDQLAQNQKARRSGTRPSRKCAPAPATRSGSTTISRSGCTTPTATTGSIWSIQAAMPSIPWSTAAAARPSAWNTAGPARDDAWSTSFGRAASVDRPPA